MFLNSFKKQLRLEPFESDKSEAHAQLESEDVAEAKGMEERKNRHCCCRHCWVVEAHCGRKKHFSANGDKFIIE